MVNLEQERGTWNMEGRGGWGVKIKAPLNISSRVKLNKKATQV